MRQLPGVMAFAAEAREAALREELGLELETHSNHVGVDRLVLVGYSIVLDRDAIAEFVVQRLAHGDFVQETRACLLDVLAEPYVLALRGRGQFIGLLSIQRSGSERRRTLHRLRRRPGPLRLTRDTDGWGLSPRRGSPFPLTTRAALRGRRRFLARRRSGRFAPRPACHPSRA